MELEKLINEVQRKIGRNVMLFQQLEHNLKVLLANGEFSGYASELQTIKEQRAATIHKQTMGQLAGQLFENTFSASEETANEPNELKEAWISFRHKIKSDENYYEERKNALASIIAERNDLIHHLWPKWDINSFESSTEIEQYLDQQREKVLSELEIQKSHIEVMQALKTEMANFLASDEATKFFELEHLRQSQLVAWLFEFAKEKARPDGWVALTSAVNFIRQQDPEEFVDLEKRYGHKKLRAIILATEFFDISEESTDKGGIRVLYRIKPDLNFTD